MPLVELRNVSKIYHLGGEEIRALDDVSLDIEAGEFISIIGPSGSGKSTLMHILGCLDSPTKGTIRLDGKMIHDSSAAELARATNCEILPVFLPSLGQSYAGHILPPVAYERSTLRDRHARQQLTQRILTALEPAIREHSDQWYHFVPVWK